MEELVVFSDGTWTYCSRCEFHWNPKYGSYPEPPRNQEDDNG
jgi:hypothetical protein